MELIVSDREAPFSELSLKNQIKASILDVMCTEGARCCEQGLSLKIEKTVDE